MQPERTSRYDVRAEVIDRLSDTLFDLAGDQDVRVIEALAAVLARHSQGGFRGSPRGLSEATTELGFESSVSDSDNATRREICRRVARRALRGSLLDPTRGATAVHRIDVSPAWSRDLLPIGMFGPFLFYRLAPRQSLADDWLSALSPSHQEIAVFDGGLHSDGHLPLRADRAFDLHSLRGSRLT
jgi:hypothetical protein